jgi:serine/threonine protein kinase
MGTLSYMSPEQAMGEDRQPDCRSDVYSLGATLYELLTLEPPFAHESPPALLSQVIAGKTKSPRSINPRVPPTLNAIVVKAMSVQPEHRYSTAAEMADALQEYLLQSDELPMPERQRWRLKDTFVYVFTVIALAFLALFAVCPSKDIFRHSFVEWNGHLYALTTGATDWDSAEAEAVARGGHLITINDAAEQEFVVRQFLSPPDKVFWIGMTDRRKEGEWQWVSGQPVTYLNWHPPREPNNVPRQHPVTGTNLDEDYGVINWHLIFEPSRGRKGTWNDFLSIQDERVVFYSFHGIIEIDSPTRD